MKRKIKTVKDDELDQMMEDLATQMNSDLKDIETTSGNEKVDDKINSATPTCWGTLQDEEFVPSFKSVDQVPSGIYELQYNRNVSQITLKKQPFKTDELYQLPSYEIQDILKDIQDFWDRRDKYREYNFVHKRGILMYGEPGCGKSGIIQLIAKQLIENNGIIINIKDQDDVDFFIDFIATFRKIEPNRPLIVLLEDLDSIAGESTYSTSKLLNILRWC
jgi:DNA replication protein DnaC